MAGTLVLDTLQNGAGTASTSADNVIRGCAKAWVNFDGTGTVAIRSSFNVSSITDNGTGDYTINFTTAMPNANYATVGSCSYYSTGYGVFLNTPYNAVPTTSAVRVLATTAAAIYDVAYVNVAIFSS